VFGEGVVNDATSVVLFNAIQNFDLGSFNSVKFLQFIGSFLYLFATSTILGVAVSCFLLPPFALPNFLIAEVCHGCRLDFSVLISSRSYTLAGLYLTQ